MYLAAYLFRSVFIYLPCPHHPALWQLIEGVVGGAAGEGWGALGPTVSFFKGSLQVWMHLFVSYTKIYQAYSTMWLCCMHCSCPLNSCPNYQNVQTLHSANCSVSACFAAI